jgi:hypothetical protein
VARAEYRRRRTITVERFDLEEDITSYHGLYPRAKRLDLRRTRSAGAPPTTRITAS